MRIGLFTPVYPPMINGIAISVKTLQKQLEKMGNDVYIITNNSKLENNFSNESFLQAKSFPIFYQGLRVPFICNNTLYEEIDKLKIDVIHNHSDLGFGGISRIYAKATNKPHIHTNHCNYYEYAISNFGKGATHILKYPIKLYTKSLCYTTDRIIAPSLENYRFLKENIGIKRNIDIIPNGIDLNKFKNVDEVKLSLFKKKYEIDDSDLTIICLSRLSKEKRIDEIIETMKYFKNSHVKLIIVGSGPDANRLRNIVLKENISNIIFTGEIKHSEVPLYYNLADIYITNSIAETQGLTVIEALASGLPVLCPNSPLYTNIVNDMENGMLFNNQEELIKIINFLLLDKDFVSFMKENTYKSIADFSIEETTKKIVNIYQEEIAKKKELIRK